MVKQGVFVALGVGFIGLAVGLTTYYVLKNKKPTPPPPPPPDTTPMVDVCVGKMVETSINKGFVYLKMADGRYLCCNDPGTIFTDGARDSETKWILEVAPGGIRIKNQYHNRYLSCEDNGGLNAAVTPDKVGKNEIFIPTCNTSTGTYNLLGANGGYVGTVGPYYDVKAIATTPATTEVIIVETD